MRVFIVENVCIYWKTSKTQNQDFCNGLNFCAVAFVALIYIFVNGAAHLHMNSHGLSNYNGRACMEGLLGFLCV